MSTFGLVDVGVEQWKWMYERGKLSTWKWGHTELSNSLEIDTFSTKINKSRYSGRFCVPQIFIEHQTEQNELES